MKQKKERKIWFDPKHRKLKRHRVIFYCPKYDWTLSGCNLPCDPCEALKYRKEKSNGN